MICTLNLLLFAMSIKLIFRAEIDTYDYCTYPHNQPFQHMLCTLITHRCQHVPLNLYFRNFVRTKSIHHMAIDICQYPESGVPSSTV